MVCSIIARHVAWSCAAMCHVAVGSVRVPKAVYNLLFAISGIKQPGRARVGIFDECVARDLVAAMAMGLGGDDDGATPRAGRGVPRQPARAAAPGLGFGITCTRCQFMFTPRRVGACVAG